MNRLGRAAIVVLLMSCLGWVRSADATLSTGRAECVSLQSKILERAVPYCVLLPPSYDEEKTRRYPILYLLHGLGDNEQFLVHSGGMNLVEDLWEEHQLGEFLIVTPAAGASFYINSRDGKRRYEDFFLQEFLPGCREALSSASRTRLPRNCGNFDGRIRCAAYRVPASTAFWRSGRAQRGADRKDA